MRTTYTSSPTVFQRFLALAVVMIGLIVASVSVSLVQVQKASAASVGSGFCESTVNDSSGVTVAVASNGDCIVSFATLVTTGGNAAISYRNWTVPAGVSSVNVLIVAGGGGGGSSNSLKTGGAGGGGGVVVATNYTVTPSSTISVGTGAGGFGGNCANGLRGGNSAFGSLTAIGGGWGSGCSATEGTGGSGGGGHFRAGARTTQTTSPGTSSNGVNITAYGNTGGSGSSGDWGYGGGGGGGGATQVGGDGTGSGGTGRGGNGGEGIANSFRTDSPIVYGSGGGGGGNATGGTGGTNAGNGCGTDTSGVGGINGVNETGGGGGGGMKCQVNAGRGGSGIVVVRYGLPALAQPSNVTAVATPSRGKSVDVSWTAVPNAQSYIVRLKSGTCDTIYGTKSGIIETSTTVTRFDMTGQIMEDNTTYKVTVAAVGDAVNYTTSAATQCVSVTTNAPVATPTINTQPASLYRTAGQNASLSVSASAGDGGTLSYQWFKSGVAITNATSDTYSLTGVATSDSGSYLVEVTNTLGGVSTSTISTTATVTVASALSIATPTTGLSGTADSAFSLSVAGSGGRASLSYVLTGTLVAGLSMSTSTGTISGTPTATGSSTVSVAVTDANGVAASTSNFTISVGYASTTVSLALAAASPQYRLTNRITATTSRAGTVNFMLGGTSIVGCEAVAAVSTTATCDWVPVDLGVAALSAEFTPTASIYSNSTTSLSPTVLGRAITVTPYLGQSKVFGDAEPVIGYSITSGSMYGSETLTGALSRVAGEAAGSYAITAGNLYNSNYVITLTDINFAIAQANQATVVLTSISGVYATGLTLTASGGSGTGAYSFTVTATGTAGCGITSGVLNATSPGTCTVTASRALSTNYFVASSVATTVTIGKATQAVVTLTSTSGTFNTNISLSASGGTGSGSYSFSVSNAGTAGCTLPSATTLRSSGAGSCTVTATRAGDDYYEPKSSAATTVTFARDSQNLLSVRDVAGDLDTGITLSVSGGSGTGALSYSVTSGTANCSVASGVVTARFVGSCLLTTTKAADTNYSQAQITNTLTFIKATQSSLQITSISGTYGTPVALVISGSSGSGALTYSVADVGTASCSVSGALLSFTTVGTCRVIATRDADSVFDARSSASTTITIDRANQPALSTATTSGDLVTGIIVSLTGGAGTGALTTSVTTGTANCTLAGGVVAARANGTCVLSISKLGDANYNAASATVTLTFAKAAAARGTLTSPTSGAAGTGITLSFTGGSGTGAVTYALVSPGTAGCSITNGVLNATSGGKCSVVITKQGDDTYADQSSTVEFTFAAPPSASQGQSEVAAVTTTTSTTTTTVAPSVSKKSKVTTTTVAEKKVASQTTTTTTMPPKSSMPIKQLVAPSLVNTPSAVGAATIGGKLARATTTRVNNQLVFNAGGFTVTLAGVKADGTIIPLSSDGLLEVQRGDTFRLDATGFAPNSNVDIWMFSKSMLLANITVGADGLVKSSFVVPKSMKDGLHHLVMVGVDRAKAEAKFEVGMNVGAPVKQWWASRVLIVIPIAVAVFIGLWLPTTVRRRKRRQVI